MSGIGKKKQAGDKELDEKILCQIKAGKSLLQISTSLKICQKTINTRLKGMGFDHFTNARAILTNH